MDMIDNGLQERVAYLLALRGIDGTVIAPPDLVADVQQIAKLYVHRDADGRLFMDEPYRQQWLTAG